MNKLLFTSALLLLSVFSFADDNEKKIKSDIKDVTVFLSGAEVTSVGNTSLPVGSTDVVFENLSQNINANSIQAKGEGDFTILSVSFRLNYLNTQPKSKELLALEDSLEAVQNKLTFLQGMRSVYDAEESMLLSNKSIGGQNVGVNSTELEKVANILRNRLTDLKQKQIDIKQKEKKLNEQYLKLSNQLGELNNKRNKATGEIVVAVNSKTGGNAKLSVSYVVSNAGWYPIYDIRAIDTKSPIQLSYKANVWQNTDAEWKNVKLTLSTGNPTLSGTKPVLNPWWLAYYSYQPSYGKYKRQEAYGKSYDGNMPAAAKDNSGYDLEEVEITKSATTSAQYTQVQENTTNFEYEISIPYTIPGDSKTHLVEIQNYSIPAMYKYYAAPRIDKDAFLLAKITGWDQYNLMSGDANIYFEGTYVGKSYLNTMSTNDTLDISLGRDKSVVVERKMLKEFCEKKIIGLNKKETYTWEISVRNKKKNDIEIIIEDQVPLSSVSEIEVEVLEMSGAKHDKEKGKLTWEMKLATGENKKLKVGYSVKHPKDKAISNL